MHEYSSSWLKIDLINALSNKEFYLEYQPIVDIDTNETVCLEALVRWNHPSNGIISPNDFILSAEKTNTIVPIGDWILKEACYQCKQWQQKTNKPIKIAVNISQNQFKENDFVKKISLILDEINLCPSDLILEINESFMISNLYETVNKLNELKALGVSLALDDFGVAYSSFVYLKDLPFDILKIGQQLTMFIVNRPNDFIIVSSIISLAKELKLEVIVEGIETEEQLKLIRQTTCKKIQGYYYSKPKHPSEIDNII